MSSVNEGYYDTGVEWLELARDKLGMEEDLDFLEGGIKQLEDHILTAKKIHDHYLDKTGVVGAKHRCNRLPFDDKLRKKKKYKVMMMMRMRMMMTKMNMVIMMMMIK